MSMVATQTTLTGAARRIGLPRRRLATCKIWIDDAFGGTSRSRCSALRQRSIAAVDVAAIDGGDLKADRESWIISLRPSRRRHQADDEHQTRQCRNAHREAPSEYFAHLAITK